MPGWRAGGRVEPCTLRRLGRGGRGSGGVCAPKGGLRVTPGLNSWGKGALNPGRTAKIGTRRRTENGSLWEHGGAPKGRGPGCLVTWGRVSGHRSAWWLVEECRGAGLQGAQGNGGSAGPTVPGQGAELCARGEPAGRSGGRFIFTRWHLQNVQLMAVGRQEVLLSVLSLFPKPARPAADRLGSRAWEGRGRPWVGKVWAGAHWGGGRGLAGRGRRAGSGPLQSFWANVCPQRWKLLGEGNRCMRRQSRREGHFGGVD